MKETGHENNYPEALPFPVTSQQLSGCPDYCDGLTGEAEEFARSPEKSRGNAHKQTPFHFSP